MPLLRIMMIDSGTGRPKIGSKAFQLGVRPFIEGQERFDMTVSSDSEIVTPEAKEGLSCSARPIAEFMNQVKHMLATNSKRRIWEIDTNLLLQTITAVHRPEPRDSEHWQIEQAKNDVTSGISIAIGQYRVLVEAGIIDRRAIRRSRP